MSKVSVCMIAYNDAAKVRDALESVKWADEIVVMDSHSTDGTTEICREYTDRIYHRPYTNHGNLRNQAVALTTHDWIFSLDTDERATPELRDEIRRELAAGPRADAYQVPRINYFLGRRIRHGGWYPDYRQPQLFKKGRMRYTEEACHDSYVVDGRLGRLREHVIQYPFVDINQFVAKHHRYSTLMVQQMIDHGKTFRRHQLVTHPLFTFVKMYVLRRGWRDGIPGLILAGLYAYYTFMKYAKYWERVSVSAGTSPVDPPSSAKLKASVAAVVITKNEERNIADCLACVAWADEIIVVDAESTDRTVEIARRYTEQVHVRPWPGYGAQKNFAMGLASSEWILIVDADERVTPALRDEIAAAVQRPDTVAYHIPRQNVFYGAPVRWGGTYPDYQIRLFRRGRARYNDVPIHENLLVDGPLGTLREHFVHYSERRIEDHFRKFNPYTDLAARQAGSGAPVRWHDLAFRPLVTWSKNYLLRQGVRDGTRGLILSVFGSMYTFVKYAKRWELSHADRH